MKKPLILIGATVLLILLASGATLILSSEHYTGLLPWESPHPEGAINAKIHSNILCEDRDVIIRLPSNYDSTAKYPVMYVLDGGSDDKHIADKLEVLSAAGYAPQTIVVGIPNMTATNRQLNLTPPFMNMDSDDTTSSFGGAEHFLSFLEKELFPFVENNYAASGERAISGNSRGGLFIMYSFVVKPDLFKARFCYSAPVWRQKGILISRISEFLNAKDTLSSFLYMSAGAKETENIKNGLVKLTAFFEKRSPIGFTWYTDFTPNAVHQDNGRISASIALGKWSEYRKTNGGSSILSRDNADDI